MTEQEQEKIIFLADGIPGAIVVLATIKRDHEQHLEFMINQLITHNIRGSNIWKIYKELCGQNIEKFLSFDFTK